MSGRREFEEGANRGQSPQFQTWQDESRVASDVDVNARLRWKVVVSSAVRESVCLLVMLGRGEEWVDLYALYWIGWVMQ